MPTLVTPSYRLGSTFELVGIPTKSSSSTSVICAAATVVDTIRYLSFSVCSTICVFETAGVSPADGSPVTALLEQPDTRRAIARIEAFTLFFMHI
ncbi:hypothetical protein D3C73_1436470 [compost metagenome]